MRAAVACIVIAAGLAPGASAQTRDAAAPATGTASISGRVLTDTQPPRPVRRATVLINSSDRTVGRTVVTDDAGRFLVPDLPAGRYTINASKKGWVGMGYGARGPGRPGRSIALADGERATPTIRLARTAAITGVVLDQNGQPPPALTMRVFRSGYSPTGERTLVFAAGTSWGPDERGTYRIYGLAPGDYYVTATSNVFFGPDAALHLTSDVDVQEAVRAVQSGPAAPMTDVVQRGVTLAPMFYPGTPNPSQATPVTVRAGEERAGVDFTVQYVASARISGTVQLPDGVKPESVRLNLVNSNPPVADFGLSGMRNANLRADSTFEFTDIVPGQYSIGAHGSAPRPDGTSQILSGVTEVDVQGEDVPGVSLQLQDGYTVSGSVRLDGTAPPPALGGLRVMLQPVKATMMTISAGTPTVGADGRFNLTAITPGRYRLTLIPPAPWIVRSSVVSGQDTLDVPIDLRQSVSDAVITLTDRTSEVSGHVTAAAGTASDYSVILFPEDRALWATGSRRIMSVRTANDGTFLFNRLPAGDYEIAAVDDVEPGEWYDPAFLQRLLPSAVKVTIAEGEKKVQDLKIGGA
jgi:carboxypeptidase family protein